MRVSLPPCQRCMNSEGTPDGVISAYLTLCKVIEPINEIQVSFRAYADSGKPIQIIGDTLA